MRNSVFQLSVFVVATILFLTTGCSHTPKKWKVIAHRSAPGYLPEHTLAGVAMAASWNVDFIEPDIVLTKDDIPVIMHDIHLEKSTDVASKLPHKKRKDGRYYVVDLTLKEIRSLNVLERGKGDPKDTAVFPGRFPRNKAVTAFQIPTLREYLETIDGLRKTTGYKLGIYPEIKKPSFHESQGKNIVRIVYDMLNEFGYEDKTDLIFIQSFDPSSLKKLRFVIKTKIPLVQLVAHNEWHESEINYDQMISPDGIKTVATYADGIGPSIDRLYTQDPETDEPELNNFMKNAHGEGLQVHPYTHRSDSLPPGFSTDEELLQFLNRKAKVDGIFSDFADRVLNWKPKMPTTSGRGLGNPVRAL